MKPNELFNEPRQRGDDIALENYKSQNNVLWLAVDYAMQEEMHARDYPLEMYNHRFNQGKLPPDIKQTRRAIYQSLWDFWDGFGGTVTDAMSDLPNETAYELRSRLLLDSDCYYELGDAILLSAVNKLASRDAEVFNETPARQFQHRRRFKREINDG